MANKETRLDKDAGEKRLKKDKSKKAKLKGKKKKKKDKKKRKKHKKVVRVAETPIGLGVFAKRVYPVSAIVGEITGKVVTDANYGSDYCIHLGGDRHLEPGKPFRFLNHSCEPNCEFDWFVGPGDAPDDTEMRERVYVSAIREIAKGEELTIEYNWSAAVAIPCNCGARSCRGWIVCPEEAHLLPKRRPEVASELDTVSSAS